MTATTDASAPTETTLVETARLQTVATPDGPFTILEAGGEVLASGWTSDPDAILNRLRPVARPAQILDGPTDAAAAVAAYYGGDLTAIDAVPVRQPGTTLQSAGWQALRRIAPGEPLTYAGFAAALGSPGAVRAAASVCARNAAALFVPCHRVLRTGGALGGFAWGVEVKQRLLEREARLRA
ncbi:methylated-DNA--[protein]-cysteine S-methyltransferase [Microbacterium sp. F1-18]|jgi:methylated-DNA-[protein]-cysteine S-methyltransferase|uniref:methylated-DNA--[protein]-cysteine S-methyltransferase n=1 Tax=unclassified Microbacterium TaxID=2609290 RepID=UPI000E72D2EC|nr:methylated-DNA--[protein]-cysteine S-methyltransferase [Microbacterium sp. AG238]RKE60018.1 methylated-DNA-[protein]-cysteine S-methyltransferase [Microbacterium sp. AG238]